MATLLDLMKNPYKEYISNNDKYRYNEDINYIEKYIDGEWKRGSYRLDYYSDLQYEEIISILKKEKKIIEDNIKIAIEHNLSFAYNEEMTKVSILVGLIPVQLSEEQTREKIQEIFNENNFTNMGEAMKVIIPKLGGIADKKLISKIVKEMF